MRITGIVAEYNPIHYGHTWHLAQSRSAGKADFIVVVMSGHFVQRGQPAVMDKWVRSRLAIEEGVDLVLELPVLYATGSAEQFARGSMSVLQGLGCVTELSFGCEAEDVGVLYQLAGFLAGEPESYRDALRIALDTGISFPAARQRAVASVLGERAAALLVQPNNILAIEYLKALHRQKIESVPPIHARGIYRCVGHHATSPVGRMASGSAIRRELHTAGSDGISEMLAPASHRFLKEHGDASLVWPEQFWPLICARILQMHEQELAQISGVTEGIEHRMKEQIRRCPSMEAYARALQSKRLPRTAVDRILYHTLLGITKEDVRRITVAEKLPVYARVLAAGRGGRRLLRLIREHQLARIPVLTNINRQIQPDRMKGWGPDQKRLLELDILASDLYHLAAGEDLYQGCDQVRHPAIGN